MGFWAENWYLVVAAVAVLAFAAYCAYTFFKRPTGEQLAAVKEWLLWAVTEAEKELGGNTGQLKLRYVYDMFVERFPSLSAFIKFDAFSAMVDEALGQMRHLLDTNGTIKGYVEKGAV